MKNYLKDLLKDKTNAYSLREFIIAISMLLVIVSWVVQLVFNIATPEYMFYSVVSLIATGCFGYSIEKRPDNYNDNENNYENNKNNNNTNN